MLLQKHYIFEMVLLYSDLITSDDVCITLYFINMHSYYSSIEIKMRQVNINSRCHSKLIFHRCSHVEFTKEMKM